MPEQPLTLREALADLARFDPAHFICTLGHPSPGCTCLVVEPTEDLRVPAQLWSSGYRYFLEVGEASGIVASFNEPPLSDDERFRLLVHYAANDAFPEWIYQR